MAIVLSHSQSDITISSTSFQIIPRALSLPQRYTPRRTAVFERHGLFSHREAVTLGEVREGLLTQAERYRVLQDERIATWHPLALAIEDQQTLSLAAIAGMSGK